MTERLSTDSTSSSRSSGSQPHPQSQPPHTQPSQLQFPQSQQIMQSESSNSKPYPLYPQQNQQVNPHLNYQQLQQLQYYWMYKQQQQQAEFLRQMQMQMQMQSSAPPHDQANPHSNSKQNAPHTPSNQPYPYLYHPMPKNANSPLTINPQRLNQGNEFPSQVQVDNSRKSLSGATSSGRPLSSLYNHSNQVPSHPTSLSPTKENSQNSYSAEGKKKDESDKVSLSSKASTSSSRSSIGRTFRNMMNSVSSAIAMRRSKSSNRSAPLPSSSTKESIRRPNSSLPHDPLNNTSSNSLNEDVNSPVSSTGIYERSRTSLDGIRGGAGFRPDGNNSNLQHHSSLPFHVPLHIHAPPNSQQQFFPARPAFHMPISGNNVQKSASFSVHPHHISTPSSPVPYPPINFRPPINMPYPIPIVPSAYGGPGPHMPMMHPPNILPSNRPNHAPYLGPYPYPYLPPPNAVNVSMPYASSNISDKGAEQAPQTLSEFPLSLEASAMGNPECSSEEVTISPVKGILEMIFIC
jgi:hypothetical protein